MYQSSRNEAIRAKASAAILQGLAKDGGLFVPKEFPKLEIHQEKYRTMSYKDFATEILSLYLDDFSRKEIETCVELAYTANFETEEVVPVQKAGGLFFIELFHGKTLAFKDLALSILPHLMLSSKRKNGEQKKILIMTATSGDTGKAALEAFQDIEDIKIVVYYPDKGVSDMQKQQMLTQRGENLCVYAISGNFDDAQSAVKRAMTGETFNKSISDRGYLLSSANSINIGRLIPQIVYYFTSYFKLVQKNEIVQGEEINIVVPTGNFGNILAAYYAKKMGLPVHKLICASNKNKILADFFTNGGTYDTKRNFYTTGSPSMDILISSNFERALYHASGGDCTLVAEKMKELKEQGVYRFPIDEFAEMKNFAGEYADEEESGAELKRMFEDAHYLIDPHTAVAVSAYRKYLKKNPDKRKVLIASTASPFKFPAFVLEALGHGTDPKEAPFDTLRRLENLTGIQIPKALAETEHLEKRFGSLIDAGHLEESIFRFLDEKHEREHE